MCGAWWRVQSGGRRFVRLEVTRRGLSDFIEMNPHSSKLPRLALLFPGQGSQRVGMGQEFARNFACAREVWARADETLGFALSELCFEGPEEELRLTVNTQPALLATSMAALRVLESELGIRAELAAGHSLGEYGALVAAGALDFADALRAVRARGYHMQQAVPPGYGTMAAIVGLELEQVAEICREASTVDEMVAPANLNAPGQAAIAGHSGAVRRAIAEAKARGAKMAVELNVSAPFHCSLLEPARTAMAPVLRELEVKPLAFGVIANVTAKIVRDPAEVIPLLTDQITAPVRWEESMRVLAGSGIEFAVELGVGRVLCGLMRRIDKRVKAMPCEDLESLKSLRQAVGLD